MNSKMILPENAKDFIFGGKSIFTVKNPKTENRFTYKVQKSKNVDLFFVSVLTSPDHYEFIGTIFNGDNFRRSDKSTISSASKSVVVFKWLIDKVSSKKLPEFIQVWHEGCCAKCGRRLTTPESIVNGYGPECIKKLKK
jgi:hypothetical protein